MHNRFTTLVATAVALVAIYGCTAKTDTAADTGMAATATVPAADRSADETAIRELDEQFFSGVRAKDANAIAATYADDAVSMPPNSPPLMGNAAVKSYNAEMLKTPQFSMTGESTSIRFSDDGTVAYDMGKYTATFADPKGNVVKDEGKFLSVLKKVDGKWKVVADAFSSNMAPPK